MESTIAVIVVMIYFSIIGICLYFQLKDWKKYGYRIFFNKNIIVAGLGTFFPPLVLVNMYLCYKQLKTEYKIQKPSIRFIIFNWQFQMMIAMLFATVIALPFLIPMAIKGGKDFGTYSYIKEE